MHPMPGEVVLGLVIFLVIMIVLFSILAYQEGNRQGKIFVYREWIKKNREKVAEIDNALTSLSALQAEIKAAQGHEINDEDMDRENFESDEEFDKSQV